jgi:hypothetical protein
MCASRHFNSEALCRWHLRILWLWTGRAVH